VIIPSYCGCKHTAFCQSVILEKDYYYNTIKFIGTVIHWLIVLLNDCHLREWVIGGLVSFDMMIHCWNSEPSNPIFLPSPLLAIVKSSVLDS